MTMEEFNKIHEHYKLQKPSLFGPATSDRPATEVQLKRVEDEIGLRLPASYRAFLQIYGGGYFGFTNIFSADPDSEFYLPLKQSEASPFLPAGLLAISDDEAGGLYVMKVDDGIVTETILYWNTDGGLIRTEFDGILQFIARCAYEAA
ncbi:MULTISPECIES: SMI1/KNR4 family protein [unclassified Rhizobium]|uniref:SMI1/KNR4 family protein n=1 Tax=unclassified Rhizobium TaxID=2613769 RepID=UPI000712BACE|nr:MULTISPECIES: SMI1/KNR4 family protein [unclassified Rhizobium]KQS95140.1 hypothetical protein ASG50_25915 [Rhizobium sp. Leaf386]KQS95674.1 hypothetical protein ASG42_29650 [Rhizobium sp. Leaf391]KQU01901.1 hypothetical protein ASG68_28995 [Rhizobium sp. Leaf453]